MFRLIGIHKVSFESYAVLIYDPLFYLLLAFVSWRYTGTLPELTNGLNWALVFCGGRREGWPSHSKESMNRSGIGISECWICARDVSFKSGYFQLSHLPNKLRLAAISGEITLKDWNVTIATFESALFGSIPLPSLGRCLFYWVLFVSLVYIISLTLSPAKLLNGWEQLSSSLLKTKMKM